MTPELWRRVSDAFDRAAELPPAAREDFLRRLREQDPEVVPHVEAMLRRGGSAAFLDGPPDRLLDWLLDEPTGPPGAGGPGVWPDRIGRFEVEGELDRGGMGVVLRVRDPQFDRPLAIKVLNERWRGADAVRDLQHEATIMARLQHPGVPPVYDLGLLDDGSPYFAMRLIEGRTLARVLEDPEGKDLPWLLHVFEQICQTVAYAHESGVVHRDLKPSNVMVGAFGEVQVMDWGVAKEVGGKTDGVKGTIGYMAPEQARGEAGALHPRCDVFGLGAVLCTVLTGQPAFSGTNAEKLRLTRAGDLSEAFARLDACGADAELVRLAKHCLAPAKEDRPADAAAVAAEVAAYQADLQTRLKKAEIEQAAAQARADAEQARAEEEHRRAEAEQARAQEEQRRADAERAKSKEERRRRRAYLASAGLAVVFVVAGCAAGTWYVLDRNEQENQKRRQSAERKAEDDKRIKEELDECERELTREVALAKKLREDLSRDLVHQSLSDLAGWKARLDHRETLLKNAREPLDKGRAVLTPELEKSLRKQKDQLEDDRKDFDRAVTLEGVRLESFASFEETYRQSFPGREYRSFFKGLGVDVEKRPAEAAEVIRKSRLCHVLVAALDHWAVLTQHEGDIEDRRLLPNLLMVARDADPEDWCNQFRQEAAWRDRGRLEELARKVKEGRPTPMVLVALAVQMNRKNGDGTSVLRGALRQSPDNFWFNLTMAQLLKDSREKAAYARAALACRPQSVAAYYSLADALENMKDDEEAIEHFRLAVERDPLRKYTAPRARLGSALEKTGKLEEAMKMLLDALEIDRSSAATQQALGRILRKRGDYKKAAASYEKAAKLAKRDDEKTLNRVMAGQLYLELGEFAPAKEAAEWALQQAPDGDDPHTHARILLKEAERCLRVQQSEKDSPPVKEEVLREGLRGELSAEDPLDSHQQARQSRRKGHRVELKAGTSYQIDLDAVPKDAFDPILRIESPKGLHLLQNDDRSPPTERRARLVFTPGADGKYALVVNSFLPNEVGHYTLKLQQVVPTKEPVVLEGKLAKTGKPTDGRYTSKHTVKLKADRSYVFRLKSEQFDTYLKLLTPGGAEVLAQNDDIVPGDLNHSRIDFTPQKAGDYVLMVTSFRAGETGAYSLTVQGYDPPEGGPK